jgi:hypothetical protein
MLDFVAATMIEFVQSAKAGVIERQSALSGLG